MCSLPAYNFTPKQLDFFFATNKFLYQAIAFFSQSALPLALTEKKYKTRSESIGALFFVRWNLETEEKLCVFVNRKYMKTGRQYIVKRVCLLKASRFLLKKKRQHKSRVKIKLVNNKH